MVELGLLDSLTCETVHLRLKKRPQALAQAVHQGGCIPKVGGEFVAAMEDMLAFTLNPTTPAVRWCASTRPPLNCWLMCESPCPPNRDDPGGWTTSIAVLASATSFCSSRVPTLRCRVEEVGLSR